MFSNFNVQNMPVGIMDACSVRAFDHLSVQDDIVQTVRFYLSKGGEGARLRVAETS